MRKVVKMPPDLCLTISVYPDKKKNSTKAHKDEKVKCF